MRTGANGAGPVPGRGRARRGRGGFGCAAAAHCSGRGAAGPVRIDSWIKYHSFLRLRDFVRIWLFREQRILRHIRSFSPLCRFRIGVHSYHNHHRFTYHTPLSHTIITGMHSCHRSIYYTRSAFRASRFPSNSLEAAGQSASVSRPCNPPLRVLNPLRVLKSIKPEAHSL